ncbi:helix-turn-helix domain-containing protein [Chelativorans sp. ZYF759]|uniref:helix-turn-helix domain-containing protein n=1 Tax=Chelativorans sp. ZYF759 TaxID=2692213 RepID=UPI00145EB45E|nr:helix-turn-helix domain-containing protein [Chelativorans sp. ZYF759]
MTGWQPDVFTPATLAERWHCSEQHVRNMIERGELRAFRLGEKLLRIRIEDVLSVETGIAVEAYEPSPSPELDDVQGRKRRPAAAQLDTLTRHRIQRLRRH